MASKIDKKSPNSTQSQRKARKKNLPHLSAWHKSGLTVVGLGASAGGLKALQAFFESLPKDTGMAFVVITHLHPEHESHLAEILQNQTKIPVTQVTGPVSVEGDHVYVLPPNRRLIMVDSKLDLIEFDEPRGQRAPIDQFFRSLASAHPKSVGIILSGGGTDGAVGIKAIKEVGGLLMVQHPDEAEHDGMPRAAIATGLADVVLPVRELARKLVDYTRLKPKVPLDPDELSEQQAEMVQHILAQVHARTGHDFSQYKRSTILRRIQRRMQLKGFTTLETYLDHIRMTPMEATSMFNDVLIGVTSFFRDREGWDALAQNVLPTIFQGKEQEEPVRVWSIGCATGEEAYTLAILLLEHASTLHRPHKIQIFASDLDDNALALARDGIYPAAIEADISPERLERFFIQQGDHYQVKREVRDIVLFTNHSVLRDPPFSRQDLIACRNLLIYLQREVQDIVFDLFHYALNPGGYLFLGNAEAGETAGDLFQTIDKMHRIYQSKGGRGKPPRLPDLPLKVRSIPPTRAYTPPPEIGRYIEQKPVLSVQHQSALETYGPPSILVDRNYAVLHVSETAGRYLNQPAGPITNDLLRLVRPELQSELRAALLAAYENGRAAVSKPVEVSFNGKPHPVIVSVHPRRHAGADKDPDMQALVVFLEDEIHELPEIASEIHEAGAARNKSQSDALVRQLESELYRMREQLQITVEEYDSSVEEMKAANEELQSMNEEYRSATEELETSKEELQSVNEELQTVNIELKTKLEEISRAHNDLENLMNATEISTLFLDRELRIQRFTPGVQQYFNIMDSDRGRPINHLTQRLSDIQLVEDAQQVLRKLIPIEREVRGPDGEWFLVRFRPYRTLQERIDGVVITLVDVTLLKMAEEAQRKLALELEDRFKQRAEEVDEANQRLSQARDQFYALFHANPIPTAITRLDNALFLDVNDAYLQYFEVEREQLIGHTAKELALPLTHDEQVRVFARLQKEGVIRNLELQIKHPSQGTRTILLSLQPIKFEGADAVIATATDITERARAEQQVRDVATSLTASEQTERHRISRVLHDDLQQNIFAVKMQLMFLAEALEKNDTEGIRLDLQQLDAWLTEAIATTRQLSIELSPPILHDEGLEEAIIWLAAQMMEQYGLEVTVNSNGVEVSFEEDVRRLVFQCVRELLFNVVKHSGTRKATVTLDQRDGKAAITVSDAGKGFDSKMTMQDKRRAHGLNRMRDRLFLLGCQLMVESEPRKGTDITIEAPIKDIIE